MQKELFDISNDDKLNNPKGYLGLYGFHKYWGKKPAELYSTIISSLTNEDDIVVDPFVGSGVIVREALLLNRKIVASDLNPLAINLANLMANPPKYDDFLLAIELTKNKVLKKINESYKTKTNGVGSHYIWESGKLLEVRERVNGKRSLISVPPNKLDLELFNKYEKYKSKKIRALDVKENSRINALKDMSLKDIFSGRAIRNIDLLIESFELQNDEIKRALYLTLTSSIGQMSKMVFAIDKGGNYQVGSWVIGFWRPKLHFEINVWNCFENKALKLLKALKDNTEDFGSISKDKKLVFNGKSRCSIQLNDAINQLNEMPKKTVSLILTDPPHGDRIPYLELSELWNAILNQTPIMEKEIVITNAKGRTEVSLSYEKRMIQFYKASEDKLKDNGLLALVFNSTNQKEWEMIEKAKDYFDYLGNFPAYYSSGSVVQDNREGSLKFDLVLLFAKRGFSKSHKKLADKFSKFSCEFPKVIQTEELKKK